MPLYYLRAPDGVVTGPYAGGHLVDAAEDLDGFAFAPAEPGADPDRLDYRPATSERIAAALNAAPDTRAVERGGRPVPFGPALAGFLLAVLVLTMVITWILL